MTSLPNSAAPGAPRTPTRLLLVDDELGVRASMARVLEHAGFSVRLADNAEQAIAALRSEGAALMITDIIMPRQNGVELIEAVRQEFPGTAVLAISGGGNFWQQGYKPEAITTSAYLLAAERAGADGVIAKPFETAELLAAVRGVLAKRGTGA
jgi:DNA-binding response OmpR family regulator